MLLEKEIQKLFQELVSSEESQIFMSGFDISVCIFDHSSKVSLMTPVYFGGNYLPHSVRYAITKSPPFEKQQAIRTFLTVDEENYRVFVNYVGPTEILNNSKFLSLLEEFGFLAEEWRIYLEEHDRNDRVYVNAR